ncbi:MAG: hypothetical protein JRI80_06170 [Deltaproteobacteria bacterium]|nr:hypothetical protein [Deltaproteobacteria bacterium]
MFPKKILDFVLARRHETGGFGAAPTLPPSVEDTYLALRILERLLPRAKEEVSAVIHAPSLVQFLQDPEDREEWHAKTGFHYVYCCRVAGMVPEREWVRQFVSDRLGDSTALADHFYCVRMIKEIPNFSFEDALTFFKTYSPTGWRSVKELWMSLVLVDGHPEKLGTDRDNLLVWIRSCQNPDGGFGFLPRTTSYMETMHTCLRTLALLKAAPLDPAGAERFILSAWTTSGGCARKNGGAPFLDATWHAVASLSLLNRFPQ